VSNGPKRLRDLGGGWELRRWEYDGAPFEARRLPGPYRDEVVVTGPDKDGDVEVNIEQREGSITLFIPVAVLRAVLEAPDVGAAGEEL
jgi:hypothetical protein